MDAADSPKRVWGSHEHKLDAKARLSIPSEFRSELKLAEHDVLYVTRDASTRSLLIFWEDAWRRFEEKANFLAARRQEAVMKAMLAGDLDVGTPAEAAEDLMRQYHRKVKLDRLGRIQLPAMLRGFAGLEGGDACRVLGKGGAIAVWAHRTAEEAHDETKFAGQTARVGYLVSPEAPPTSVSSDGGEGAEE